MIENTTVSTKEPNIVIPPIVLASGSPRRRELLSSVGLPFEVVAPKVDEKALDVSGLSPADQVVALARFKGDSVAHDMPESLVIAADTIVVLGEDILGKPEDRDDAFRMLHKLQGTTHSVFSAIAVFHRGENISRALETRVRMRPLSDEEIWCYIDTGEPMDKAGAYAIQGVGSVIVEEIQGCYFNVVGMSMILLNQLCKELGIKLVL